MEAHTAKERKLKSDIIQKNILRKDLLKRLSTVNRWTEKLTQIKNLQKQKKIEASIARYQEGIEPLKKELILMCEDLENRIKEEMTYSEEEVKAFQASLQKSIKELKKVQKSLDEADKKDDKSEKSPETMPRLKRLLREETKKIKRDEKELQSEERDKVLFTLELKRIALDRELFSA